MVKDGIEYQRIAEVYRLTMEKQSIQIQLSRLRLATFHNLYAAPIQGQDTLVLVPTEPGNLFRAGGDLNAHSPLWDDHQPADQRGELVEDLFLSQNASILNDGTATCVNWGTGGLSTPDITAVSNAWSTGTEWRVGENLDSDQLPITTTTRCKVPAASAPQCRASWNTRNVD